MMMIMRFSTEDAQTEGDHLGIRPNLREFSVMGF